MHEPLPNVKVPFAVISREESLRGGPPSSSSSKSNVSAFSSRAPQPKKPQPKNQKPILVCKNCGIKGHTIAKCYKLIGYPKNPKTRESNPDRTYVNNVEPPSQNGFPFSNEQITRILELISEKGGNEEMSANMEGIKSQFFVNMATVNSNTVSQSVNSHECSDFSTKLGTWVIDSELTNTCMLLKTFLLKSLMCLILVYKLIILMALLLR